MYEIRFCDTQKYLQSKGKLVLKFTTVKLRKLDCNYNNGWLRQEKLRRTTNEKLKKSG